MCYVKSTTVIVVDVALSMIKIDKYIRKIPYSASLYEILKKCPLLNISSPKGNTNNVTGKYHPKESAKNRNI